MIQLTTREGNILLAKVAADDALTIEGKCGHGFSMFDLEHDCEHPYRHALSIGPDTLGSCDCCGEDQPMDGHLLKQPFGNGYYCDPCDRRENAHLRADPCLGDRG